MRVYPFAFFYLLFSAPGIIAQSAGASPPDLDLGVIDFPTSAAPPAQKYFHKGVLFLHSFEYADAREQFLQAQAQDPAFALAYWGEAMTYNHPLWREQDSEKGRAALEKLAPTREERQLKAPTEREKGYMEAVEELYCGESKEQCDWRYSIAMAGLRERYPEDLEAASFYALSLLGTAQGRRNFRTYMRAASVAQEVFSANPRHPGAVHYLIHSFDDPIHAPLGLRAARTYAEIAPDAPHALHMPSHIFVALGYWDDSVEANSASARAAIAKKAPRGAYHALRWKHYSLLQLGRYEEASRLLDTMDELVAENPSEEGNNHIAFMRSAQIMETSAWDSTLLQELDVSSMGLKAKATVLCTRGMQSIHRGVVAEALALVEELKGLPIEDLEDEDDQAAIRIMRSELQALLLLRLAQKGEALRFAREAVEMEERRAYEYGPPVPIKPALELLAETFLALRQANEAKMTYAESLNRYPGRSLSLLGMGRVAEIAGDPYSMRLAYESLRKNWKNGDPELTKVQELPSGDGPSTEGDPVDKEEPQSGELGTVPNFSSYGGKIFFGGQPSPDDLELLKERGVRTIVNLKSDSEMESLAFDEDKIVQDLGMGYVRFPIGGSPLPQEDDLDNLLDLLGNSADAPLFMHCESSNRVGFVWALYQGLRNSQTVEEAIAQGEKAGLRSSRLRDHARGILSHSRETNH